MAARGTLSADNPGIVSIPVAFFLGWPGSVTDWQRSDPARFARMQVRALTGVGAERGGHSWGWGGKVGQGRSGSRKGNWP